MLVYGTIQKYNCIVNLSSASSATSTTTIIHIPINNDMNNNILQTQILQNIIQIETVKKELFQQLPLSLYNPSSSLTSSSTKVANTNPTSTTDVTNTTTELIPKLNTTIQPSLEIIQHIHSLLVSPDLIPFTTFLNYTKQYSTDNNNHPSIHTYTQESTIIKSEESLVSDNMLVKHEVNTTDNQVSDETNPLTIVYKKIEELRRLIKETDALVKNF